MDPPLSRRVLHDLGRYAIGRTFAAWGPFGPGVTSNSTFWFSSRFRYPSPWIALKCTNTSGPSSWEMKPYPFSELNHFTVPVATAIPSFLDRSRGRCPGGLRLEAGEGTARQACERTEPSRKGYQPAPSATRSRNPSGGQEGAHPAHQGRDLPDQREAIREHHQLRSR